MTDSPTWTQEMLAHLNTIVKIKEGLFYLLVNHDPGFCSGGVLNKHGTMSGAAWKESLLVFVCLMIIFPFIIIIIFTIIIIIEIIPGHVIRILNAFLSP